MTDSVYDEVIKKKITEVGTRSPKKRSWAKLDESFLTSSINYRMELSEQAVFVKLILMSIKYGPVPGLISDNDVRPMPYDYLAHLATCSLELLESTIKKGVADNSIYENSHGIFLIHFDEYQFTEYDRQKPYRQQAKKNQDPERFKNQKLGHMVKR